MKKRQHNKVKKHTTIKSHISDKQKLKELNLKHCRPGKLFVLSNNPKSEKPSLLLPTPFITSGCCSWENIWRALFNRNNWWCNLHIRFSSVILYYTILYSTLLYSTLPYSTLLYSSLFSSPLLYSTLLHSTLQLIISSVFSLLLFSPLPPSVSSLHWSNVRYVSSISDIYHNNITFVTYNRRAVRMRNIYNIFFVHWELPSQWVTLATLTSRCPLSWALKLS